MELPDAIPELTPKPTPKKRGVLFLSPEDMQEANKSMKEKGIKAKDVKNLPLLPMSGYQDNMVLQQVVY